MDHPSAREPRAGAFGAWGALAGLIGGLCCIGPSAAVLLGLGSSSALFGLQLNHTLALALGGVLLLCGALLGLRRARACALRPGIRWRRAALMLVAFGLSYALLGVLVPTLAAQREEAAEPPIAVSIAAPAPAPVMRRVTLIVEKMECPPCASAVRILLKRKPYIYHFVAETYNQQVIIDYDSRQTDAHALLALIPRHTRPSLISDEPLP